MYGETSMLATGRWGVWRASSIARSAAPALCAVLAIFAIYTILAGQLTAQVQRGLILLIAGVALTLLKPLSRSGERSFGRFLRHAADAGLIALFAFSIVYLLFNYFEIATYREGLPNDFDVACYAAGTLAILEGVRRSQGYVLFAVVSVALLYMIFGHLLPAPIGHHGIPLRNVLETVFGLSGVFGIALAVVVNVVLIFVIYGAVLEHTGAGRLFIDLAVYLTGRSRGGPAQSAVVASALFGTINGSGPANVASTGSFTIPLMIRLGYTRAFAGGVEATASCVGQIMPPVMGAGAFIMAEVTGIPYGEIMLAALVPSLLFIASLLINVRLRASRENLATIALSSIPRFSRADVLKLVILAASMAAIVVGIFRDVTPALAGLAGIAVLYSGAFASRDMRPTVRRTAQMLVDGGRNAIPLVMACAGIGIVIASISQTGLAIKLVQAILSLGDESLFLALLATALCSLIIGMGLPTAASYLMVVFVAAPAVVELGLDLLGAHMFIFYFAVLSAITPPVAICAYAAAGISGGSVMATAIQAMRLGAVGFVIPFIWIYSPELLMQHVTIETAVAIAAAFTAVWTFAAANAGHLFRRLTGWERAGLCAIGVLAIPDASELRLAAITLSIAAGIFVRATALRQRAGT